MAGLAAGLAAGFAALSPSNAAQADDIEDAIVFVQCTKDGETRTGSGVVVSAQGHVLTARHVAPVGSDCVGSLGVADQNIAERLVLRPQDVRGYDTALLQFPRTDDYTYLRYCALSPRMIRKPIFAAGYPSGSQTGKPSFRAGIMSTTFETPEGFIETDSLTAQGMSGGPILADDEKSLIGIVSGVEYNDQGEPVFYGITPVSRITVQTFQLTENGAGCYHEVPSVAQLQAQIATLSDQLREMERIAELNFQQLTQMNDHPLRLSKAEEQLHEIEQNFNWFAEIDERTGDLEIHYSKLMSGDLAVDAIGLKVKPYYNEMDSQRRVRNKEGSVLLTMSPEPEKALRATETTASSGSFRIDGLMKQRLIDSHLKFNLDNYDPEYPVTEIEVQIVPMKDGTPGKGVTVSVQIPRHKWAILWEELNPDV